MSAAPAVDPPSNVECAGAVAAGVERDVAACGGGCGGFGEGQEGQEQGGDREGDQEGFTPPPPDRVSAAAVRRARWGVVGRLAAGFTVFTLHQWAVVGGLWGLRLCTWRLVVGPGSGLGGPSGC